MTRYTVFKHKFLTEGDRSMHTLEFIVSTNGHPISENTLKKISVDVLKTLANSSKVNDDKVPVYDFGSLKVGAFLDDIKKLIKLDRTKRKGVKVQIWYDKNEEFAFWDDGVD